MENTGFCPIGKADTLLLAVDGTRFGDGAVHEAMNFARRCSSRLIVLFPLVATMGTESESPLTHEKEESEAETYLGKIKKQALEMGIPYEGIICEAADAADCIVDEARERAADMIIIGKRGISGWKKLLIGETAANVIGKAPCKVLVVPAEGRISYKKILIGTDGSKNSEAAAADGIGIAQRCGSSVIALSAIRSEDERIKAQQSIESVAKAAKEHNIECESVIAQGSSSDAIVATAAGRGVDLIVVGTYGLSHLKQLLMGSSTERVIENAGCSVLVSKASN